ncbi:MAG TPA: gluconate 2-dehydrogenase subunit 3 family protein [Dinghuibacter sp.]|jgi:hypothetical protein|uniref:gluconate 2-dehydrogenase subunit 3 family protein n=1 Tax=Dinghuibacter sp. TaxID=2024697 RepID=UPI002BD2BB31|nr:gluconate 2-dehydrogenase subunit 3 family protein [Dinghuibacter sp.]HTJ11116.1 gluconate 2-dehydrogenase subunit 3 family protein [Dinghuibacter sp.]
MGTDPVLNAEKCAIFIPTRGKKYTAQKFFKVTFTYNISTTKFIHRVIHMKRRQAIGSIAVTGLAGLGLFGGIEWHAWHKTPDFQFLETHQKTLLALAEIIIPTGDTPGAKNCGVDKFIIGMIRDCTDTRDANTFIDGLKNCVQYSYDTFGKNYEDCTTPQQVDILHRFERQGRVGTGLWGKVKNRYWGKSFFTTLKELTVVGYCTSEAGASQGLSYVAIPTAYHGCVAMAPGQRSWATR